MDTGPATTRRALLAGAGAAATGLGGCLEGVSLGVGRARGEPVSILAAGSLHHALDRGLRERVDVPLAVEARGSAALARQVAAGQKDPDVVSIADVALFDGPLRPPWHVEFATNALVVAYDPATPGGRRIRDAGRERWYEALLADNVRFGRTDPDLDPLGYRTLFALGLASAHYGTDVDLRAAVPAREQVYPETQLLAGFETGAIDAAMVYRSMAVDRGYDFLALPAALDLGSPAHRERYATASYQLPDGTRVAGDVISYAATARRRSPRIDAVVDRHVAGDYLAAHGFGVPETYPRVEGDAPSALAD